jgi:hypothetical protein
MSSIDWLIGSAYRLGSAIFISFPIKRPKNMASTENSTVMTLSIRLVRSFEHRNIRHITLRGIDSSGQMTGSELKQRILTSS